MSLFLQSEEVYISGRWKSGLVKVCHFLGPWRLKKRCQAVRFRAWKIDKEISCSNKTAEGSTECLLKHSLVRVYSTCSLVLSCKEKICKASGQIQEREKKRSRECTLRQFSIWMPSHTKSKMNFI